MVRTGNYVKQIQTANICLNVERYCISVILRAKADVSRLYLFKCGKVLYFCNFEGKSWTPLEKNPVGPPPGEKSWIRP